jgi:hypothetical protein
MGLFQSLFGYDTGVYFCAVDLGPAAILAELRLLVESLPQSADLAEHLTYLEKREALMQYSLFQAAGWPIGDGAVESSNKLVVEARLKGSGMHWARPHVNPMLALRNMLVTTAGTKPGHRLRWRYANKASDA